MKGSSEVVAIRESKQKTRREVVSRQPRSSTELAVLEPGRGMKEAHSLSALPLENAARDSSEAASMVSLGQRLRWRRCSVELEGRKPLAVMAGGTFSELAGETGTQW